LALPFADGVSGSPNARDQRTPLPRLAEAAAAARAPHRRKALTWLAAACGVSLAFGTAACRDYTTIPLSEQQQVAEPTGPRVRFPAGQMPVLQVSAGERRQIGSVLNVPRAMQYGEYVWNEDGVPAGKPWILVNLKAQTISVFRGADEIATAITLYGVDEKPTPTGRFTILEKSKDHWSNLYDAPMPYTLRLTRDGVAIHGSDVREGAGTHGCLGVPLEFASRLFKLVGVGTEVLILPDVSQRVRTVPPVRNS
jgi:hypothetical protein